MLRDKTYPQHFDPLSRDLLHNRRIIQEPPATEGHEIVEFSRVYAEFVLVLAAEHAYQKPILWKIAAQAFERSQVRAAHCVSRPPDSRVPLPPYPNHQRQRQIKLAARRKNCFSE